MKGVRATRWGSALAAVGAGALVSALVALSGCGGAATIDPLAQAAQVSGESPGAHVSMTTQVSSSQLSAPLTIGAAGYVDLHQRSGRFTIDLSGIPQLAALGGGGRYAEEIFLFPVFYLKAPFLASRLPGGRTWMKVDLQAAGQSAGINVSQLSSLGGSNPADTLQYLRGAGQVSKVGSELLEGVPTDRYRATIELDRLVQRAPAAERASIEQSVAQLGKLTRPSFPMEVWVDPQHRVRRMRFAITESLPGVGSTTTTLDAHYTDYGPVPAVTPPPPGEVFDATSLASNGLAAALGH